MRWQNKNKNNQELLQHCFQQKVPELFTVISTGHTKPYISLSKPKSAMFHMSDTEDDSDSRLYSYNAASGMAMMQRRVTAWLCSCFRIRMCLLQIQTIIFHQQIQTTSFSVVKYLKFYILALIMINKYPTFSMFL